VVIRKPEIPRPFPCGILIVREIGFISNKEESDYLNSKAGQDQVIKSLYDAVILYKNAFFGQSEMMSFESSTNEKNTEKAEVVDVKVKEEYVPKNENVNLSLNTLRD
jgi:N-acetylmuramoyl-L-alanine amidase